MATNRTNSVEQGGYLARLREEAGFNQIGLAKTMGWSAPLLSRVESGERAVSDDELREILTAIGSGDARRFMETSGREWSSLPKPPLGHPSEDILWEADGALRDVQALSDNPDIKNSFVNQLDNMEEDIRKYAGAVLRSDYSVAFVGDIGVGKTTAICRALGLETPDAKTAAPSPALEVGAGGITVCEVHIVEGAEYAIRVEPLSEREIRREVREFCVMLKEPPAASEDDAREDDASAPIGTSKEIARAIRNMSGLTGKRRKYPDGRWRQEPDPAQELAEIAESVDELVVEILALMKLDARTRREIRYTPSSAEGDRLVWLKERFMEVNNGRAAEFSIPKRIEVVTPERILGDKSMTVRVIDTKGIDTNSQRGDIETLFGEPNTVSVLCSPFNSTPSPSVQNLLERAAAGGYEQIEYRAAILGLPQNKQALAVRYDDGTPVEEAQEGYDLKKLVAEDRLTSIKIPNVPVEFFNALSDDPKSLRDFMLNAVERLRGQRAAALEETVKDARSLLDNFERAQFMTVRRDAARRLAVWLSGNGKLDLPQSLAVESSLMQAIDSVHASSLRASVRREGEWYSLEYSDELAYGARVAAVNAVQSKLGSFHGVVDNILADSQLEEAHGFVRQARRVVASGAETLYRKCGLSGSEIHARYMKPARSLWDKSNDEWGRGPGYRIRVAGHHSEWFNDPIAALRQNAVKGLIINEWAEIMGRLSSILDEVLDEPE